MESKQIERAIQAIKENNEAAYLAKKTLLGCAEAGELSDEHLEKLACCLREGRVFAGEVLYKYLLRWDHFCCDIELVDCLRSEKEEVRKWAKKLLLKLTDSGWCFSVSMNKALETCLEDGIEGTVDIWLAYSNNHIVAWSDKFISSLRKGVNGADMILLRYVQQDFKYVRDPLESIISCFKDGIKGAKAILLAYITFHGVSNKMKEALTECAKEGINIDDFAPYM